jgi:hypothetical protein
MLRVQSAAVSDAGKSTIPPKRSVVDDLSLTGEWSYQSAIREHEE